MVVNRHFWNVPPARAGQPRPAEKLSLLLPEQRRTSSSEFRIKATNGIE